MPTSRRSLLALASLLACRPRGRVQPPCRGAAEYQGWTRRDAPASVLGGRQARPIDGALDDARAAALDAALAELLEKSRAPGVSAAVAIPGAGSWSRQRGLACAEPETPLGDATRFQACSVGKLITSIVVHRHVERGELRLDDVIARWFPEFPEAESVTIEHLLRHTGGVRDFNSGARLEFDNLRYRPPAALIAEVAHSEPVFCPGATWAYSNTGYVMLGAIVEQLRGQPFAEVIAAEVCAPLGLQHTAANTPETVSPEVVRAHRERAPLPATVDYATPHAAGYVASTAGDLVRLLHALLAGQLLREATVRGMLRDMAPMFEDPNLCYGAGIMLYTIPGGPGTMVGHSGGAAGARAIVAYLPDEPAYVAVMFNDERPAEAGLWALVQALRATSASRRTG